MDLPGAPSPVPDDEISRAASHADDPRKWWALTIVLLAQLMIVLDTVIVNVAIPSIQTDLGITLADASWIVTAYVLPFGALLLLGGRIADYLGRKRVFCIATAGFAVASGLGGLASEPGVLYAARALQGAFAAVMAPTLLAIMSLGFPAGRDRALAFGAFGAISAVGATLGLIIGGLLTEYLSWRWCLLVNVPVSMIAVTGATVLLRESRVPRTPRLDVGGAALGVIGLFAVIFGTTRVAEHGWTDEGVLFCISSGLLVLAALPVWELGQREPLLPLGLFRHRARVAAYVAMLAVSATTVGVVLLLLIYLQGVQGAGPVEAGLRFVPYPVAGILVAPLTMRLLALLSARVILVCSALASSAGTLSLIRIGTEMNYVTDMLPGMLLLGAGGSGLYVVASSLGLSDVSTRDVGIASALVNTVTQIGVAFGVALLTSVAADAARDRGATTPDAVAAAIAHGNDTAYAVAGVLVLGFGVLAAVIAPPAPQARDAAARAMRALAAIRGA